MTRCRPAPPCCGAPPRRRAAAPGRAAPARSAWRLRRAAGRLAPVAAALLLTACEAVVVLDLDLDADGSGRVEVRLEVDEPAAAALEETVAESARVAGDAEGGSAGDGGGAGDEGAEDGDGAPAAGDPLDAFTAVVEELDGWEATEAREADGGRTVAAVTHVDGPDELEEVTAALAGALDGPEGRLLGPLAVAVGEETLRLEGELAADVDPAAALGWAGRPEDLRVDGEPLEAVLDRGDGPLAVRLTAEMPGTVRESDADAVDGRRVTWQAVPGEVREIHAVAERDGRGWPLWGPAAVGGLAAALALAAGILRWWRLRRR